MKNDIKFEYNWCEYLTRCPHYKSIDVGSFECHCCKFNEGIELIPPTEQEQQILNLRSCDKDYCKRYFLKQYGKCKCSHR